MASMAHYFVSIELFFSKIRISLLSFVFLTEIPQRYSKIEFLKNPFKESKNLLPFPKKL